MSHYDAFAIAKMKQADFEADATVRRLVRAPEEVDAKPEGQVGAGLLPAGRRRWRLFGRVRPA